MVTTSTPDVRTTHARRYLAALRRSLGMPWRDAYSMAIRSEDWLDRLALIHPEHYRDFLSLSGSTCPVRGARTFDQQAAQQFDTCASPIIWGYPCECPMPTLCADHCFPWSLGGPTVSANKILLCREHNSLKGADIHFYPWERGQPEWLVDVIERLFRSMPR